jgi:serine acetyltransferase
MRITRGLLLRDLHWARLLLVCGSGRIGNNVAVGAGSVVTKSIRGGVAVAGNPARIIRDIESYKHKALDLATNNKKGKRQIY